MIGLWHYLHFKNDEESKFDKKVNARCAFAVDKLADSLSLADPTLLINDKDKENPAKIT